MHTGQHYDALMSDIFFKELGIPKPDYDLGIGSGSQGEQTGKMLSEIEKVFIKERPDMVLVYGDTNSTLAGALAASKLNLRVAHIEAGLRSFDRLMPEEVNRVLTDHLSNLLFCPTLISVDNLAKEGITEGIHLVGDVMVDAVKYNQKIADEKSQIIEELGLEKEKYLVITVHRPSNTNNKANMTNIIRALEESGKKVIFPAHPRTKKYLLEYGLWDRISDNVMIIEPLGYLDMLKLMGCAEKILTDSGGIQKEAYMLGVPCITLRENTEWVETIEDGWNILVGTDKELILKNINFTLDKNKRMLPYGNGNASIKILSALRGEKTFEYK